MRGGRGAGGFEHRREDGIDRQGAEIAKGRKGRGSFGVSEFRSFGVSEFRSFGVSEFRLPASGFRPLLSAFCFLLSAFCFLLYLPPPR